MSFNHHYHQQGVAHIKRQQELKRIALQQRKTKAARNNNYSGDEYFSKEENETTSTEKKPLIVRFILWMLKTVFKLVCIVAVLFIILLMLSNIQPTYL